MDEEELAMTGAAMLQFYSWELGEEWDEILSDVEGGDSK